jgi:hypothetical protein
MNMSRKFLFGGLWLSFLLYALLLAPPDDPDTFSLIERLSAGEWAGLNPLIIALFNLMGIWPMVYCSVLFADGRGQRLPAWPFALGSFAFGAFLLLPYLALRQANPTFKGSKTIAIRIWDSRWFAATFLLGAIVLMGYGLGMGLSQGWWGDFVTQWQTSRFIHVMSLDFCLLTLLFPTLIQDDLARRGVHRRDPLWGLSLFPLVGACLYLVLRPSLPESQVS